MSRRDCDEYARIVAEWWYLILDGQTPGFEGTGSGDKGSDTLEVELREQDKAQLCQGKGNQVPFQWANR